MVESATVRVITLACPVCHETSELILTREQFNAVTSADSPHIRDLFPGWNADKRELLITGTHAKCWDKIFTLDDVDDEDEGDNDTGTD
jgi:hypothetical protein